MRRSRIIAQGASIAALAGNSLCATSAAVAQAQNPGGSSGIAPLDAAMRLGFANVMFSLNAGVANGVQQTTVEDLHS